MNLIILYIKNIFKIILNNNKKIFTLILVFFILFSCVQKIKNTIILNLNIKDSKDASIKDNSVVFSFNSDNITLNKLLTKKEFSKYILMFTPFRKDNLDNSFSIFIHYQDEENFYRFNIFLKNKSVHLYKKNGNKINNILYLNLKDLNNDYKNNIFTIKVNDDKIEIDLNGKIIFSNKLEYKKGKVGIGAYGKKSDKAEFIIKDVQ